MAKPLVVKIIGEADFKAATSKIQGAFGKIGKVAAVGGLALGAAAVTGAGAALKLGQSFDSAYDNIIAGTGATGEALKELQGSFDNVLASGPDSFGDVSIAIADVNTALGLTGKPLEDLSSGFLDLARVSGEELGGQIKSVTRLFGDWGIAAEDQALSMDKLWTISQATGIGVSELSDQLVKTGAPLRQLGFSVEESAALFGKWNKEGVNSDIIFSGVRQAISRMAKEGKNIPDAFGEATEAIQNAGSASEATTKAIEIFGAEAGPDMAAAIREGRFEIDDLVAAMDNAEGAVGRTADQTESFGEKWNQFKNQLAVAFKPAALAVFDALGVALDYIGPIMTDTVVPAITSFFDALKSGESDGSTIQNIAVAIRDIAIPVFEQLKEAWETVKQAFQESEGDGGGVFASIITAATTFAAFVTETLLPAFNDFAARLVEVWEEIGPDVTEAVGQIVAIVSDLLTLLSETATVILEGLAVFWADWGDEITAVARVAWDLISGIIGGALDIIQGVIRTVTAIIRGDWSGAWDGIKQVLSGVWTIIKSIVRVGIESIKGAVKVGLAIVRTQWTTAWNSAKALVSGVWTSIKATVRGGASNIAATIRGLPRRITSAARGMWNAIYNELKKVVDRIRDLWSKLDFKLPSVTIPFTNTKVGGGSIGGLVRRAGRSLFRASGDVLTEATPFIGGEYLGANSSNPEIVSPYKLMKKAMSDALREGGGQRRPGISIENVNVVERPMWRELDELEAIYAATS